MFVLAMVRLAEPEDGEIGMRGALQEIIGGAGVAFDVQGYAGDGVGAGERAKSRSVGPGAVEDPAVAVRVMGTGGSGGDVVEHHRLAAGAGEALGQGGDGEGPALEAAPVVHEVGVADVVMDELAVFHKCHGVALESVGGGQAAGHEAGGGDAGGGGEDGAMGGEAGGGGGEGVEVWGGGGADHVPAEAVEDDDGGAAGHWRLRCGVEHYTMSGDDVARQCRSGDRKSTRLNSSHVRISY